MEQLKTVSEVFDADARTHRDPACGGSSRAALRRPAIRPLFCFTDDYNSRQPPGCRLTQDLELPMTRQHLRTPLFGLLLSLACATAAQAHFIWLLPVETTDVGTRVQVYFAEDASPDEPALLDRVTGLQVWKLQAGAEPQLLPIARDGDALCTAGVGDDAGESLYVAAHDLGVLNRGDAVFRLQYYAKSGPDVNHPQWTSIDAGPQLRLDVVPVVVDDELVVRVMFDGQPAEGAQVTLFSPKMDGEATTDAQGTVKFPYKAGGVVSLRAKVVEPVAGELDGKSFPETRHYSTIAFNSAAAATTAPATSLAPLAQAVTSFGGAVDGDTLYIYGGHTGGAHSYSADEQGHTLLSLKLDGSGAWESLADGPGLQGLALVAHNGTLYRLGGFSAKNAKGEENLLVSNADVAAVSTTGGEWQALPSLPEPRSSFDAAVQGDTIYVIGGWQLRGEEDSIWHTTAWKLDLSQAAPEWSAIPSPPFQRRALAVADFDGKIYAIGGMQSEGGPTTKTSVFDPATGNWTDGPSLVGEQGMTGFGASAFATGGRLYVSTHDGELQRLSEDGAAWEIVQKLPTARFFHRMLPVNDHQFVVVGGANMGSGKFTDLELIDVE
jgi:N-acetylneuraminic acid mutarotase